jgi:protein HOOK3
MVIVFPLDIFIKNVVTFLQIKDAYIKIFFLARDDYRMKAEMLEKNLLEAQSKVEELQKTVDEARHLKDEVDILRETADKAVKYEATISSYKKKLEDYGDLRRQMKILEDKNTEYMQQNMELEEVGVSDFLCY